MRIVLKGYVCTADNENHSQYAARRMGSLRMRIIPTPPHGHPESLQLRIIRNRKRRSDPAAVPLIRSRFDLIYGAATGSVA